MALYGDSAHAVPSRIDALHADEINSFAKTGTWGSAAQRTAVAALTRKVRVEAGLQDSCGDEALVDSVALPEPVQRLVGDLALGGIGIDRDFSEQVQAEGVTEGAYVEIVALASRIVNLDIFARGIGVEPRPLSKPTDTGTPSFERPVEAVDEGFFTASVPNLPEGGESAKILYGDVPTGNVFRAASLVVEEGRRVRDLVENQYFPRATMMNFADVGDHALSRVQIELVATKVSEYNQCFYWTSAHAFMLRESGKIEKRSYNLNGTIDPTVDSGVDHGNVLFDFAIAVASNKPDLDGARDALVTAMGSPAVVTASLTAATFSLLDRIANGIGISLDAPVLQGSADFREELGINAYPSAANSLR